jgi:hypothetical protein
MKEKGNALEGCVHIFVMKYFFMKKIVKRIFSIALRAKMSVLRMAMHWLHVSL